MRILIVPDLHLGAGTSIGKDNNKGLNSRIEDQKNLLEFVLKTARKKQVNKIVVLGDIWEHPKPDPTVVYIFLDWLVRCAQDFTIDVVQGNHDFIRTGSNKTSMLDCIDIPYIEGCWIYTEIDTSKIAIKNGTEALGFVYVPFTDRRQLCAKTTEEAKQKLFNDIKMRMGHWGDEYKKICFGHLALEGSMWVGNEIADDHNEIFVTKKMMKDLGFDYVFMGHVHKPQVISKSNPYMAHVGSLDRTKFTGPDATEKHVTLFDTVKDTIENIKLPCRNLVDFPIFIPNVEDETEFVINYIDKLTNEHLEDAIVRLRIESSSPEYKYINREKIGNFLKKAGVFNISSVTEIKHGEQVLKNDVGIDETMGHNKAIDIFVDNMKGSDQFKSEVKKVCKEIIKEVRGK